MASIPSDSRGTGRSGTGTDPSADPSDAGGGRRPPEPDPDRAALDELRRAFGVELAEIAGDLDDDATAAGEVTPYEFDIVEQDPLPPASPAPAPVEAAATTPAAPVIDATTAPEPAPAPPRPVIRIDGLSGNVPVEPNPMVATGPAALAPQPAAESSVPVSDATAAETTAAETTAADTTSADTSEPDVAGIEPLANRQVIAIEADDLPDAVYVEGSLDDRGSASIVFIEDDADSDALTPESDRDLRRGIEPRMRERRVAVKRAQGRKRLKWFVLAIVLVLIGVGVLATLGSSLFAIRDDQITVTGNVYTDPERLQAVVDELAGTPVLVADTQAAERELEAIPWVADAKVTTHFPHAATIDLRERQAVATYQGPDGRFRVLDPEGRVLDVIDKYPFAYVLITGPDPVDLDASEIAPQGYQGAADLAKNLTSSVRGQVERIDVTADGSHLSMWLDDGSEVSFGEARDLFVKLVRLETVLSLNPDCPPGKIDVSTDETTSPCPSM